MSDFTEAVKRAVKERSEPYSGSAEGLSALSAMVRASMRAQFDDWVRKVGRTNAERLWLDHFPGESIPK